MKQPASVLFIFILISSLFFLWGFAHNLDPILIPHLKRSFALSTTQATLVDSAVFVAYFLMALPAGFLMKRLGFKAGIITGLLLFASGALLFVPAANKQSYSFFLFALFIIACGLAFLETAANPLVILLGRPEKGPQRLNLAQSFNGLAAALAPVIGGRVILNKGLSDLELDKLSATARQAALASEAATVKTPYVILAIVLIIIAIVFSFVKLPGFSSKDGHAFFSVRQMTGALRDKRLLGGVLAQFFYVGAQVSVFSLFILFAKGSTAITDVQAADYLGICGMAFLIGRFIGTALMQRIAPATLLMLYAILSTVLSVVAILGNGLSPVYAVIAICFFMSIMFPTIFALGLEGLHEKTEMGSSLMIMSIVGGALLPRCFGMISDWTGNIRLGYIVPLCCFIAVAVFAFSARAKAMPTGLSNIQEESSIVQI